MSSLKMEVLLRFLPNHQKCWTWLDLQGFSMRLRRILKP